MNIAQILIAGAAVAAMAAPAPVFAQEHAPRVFQGSGPWTADFGADYCRLMRTFRDGEDEVTLAFERIQPGPMARLLVVGDSVRPYRGADRIGYRFAPSGSEPEGPTSLSSDFASSRTPEGERMTILSLVALDEAPRPAAYDPQAEKARAEQIRSLVLEDGLLQPLQFDTGTMGDVVTVLQGCTSDLIATWGIDEERHARLQRGVIPRAGPLIGRNTVPFGQFARLTGNYNQVRVMVNASGEATSCHIHFPTLEESTNAQICEQVLENAQFEPALDGDGEPLDSYWLVPVFALLGPPQG